MTAIQHRYEFVYLFDVTNGNPNGDPDAGNLPRLDPETNRGLVTDVCLKRKVRNYVAFQGGPGNAIFIREREPLNRKIAEACTEVELETFEKPKGGWDTQNAKRRSVDEIVKVQRWLCEHYYDVRAFGGVMSTGPNAGQIRGPIQMTFATSVDPVVPLEVAITRVTDVDKEEGEMGRKHIIPYGLYRAHGFISANLAQRTGFAEADLSMFWNALKDMFDHDRSAARGEMSARRLVVFKHDTILGSAPAHKLFDLVAVAPLDGVKAPRSYADYKDRIKVGAPPAGVRLIDML
jgi:CRISPR-associated protein Csd2